MPATEPCRNAEAAVNELVGSSRVWLADRFSQRLWKQTNGQSINQMQHRLANSTHQ